MRTCFYCAKLIRGQCRLVVPTMLHVRLFGEFTKTYHPACYDKAEVAAAAELKVPHASHTD